MKIHAVGGLVLAAVLCAGSGYAQVNELVSLDSSGSQENYNASLPPPGRFVSADGRFVIFVSDANNLVPGDTNGTWDVFVRDRVSRTTERVSVDSNGVEGNGISGLFGISISGDGRFAAFESASNNLVPGDTNGAREVFVHDRVLGTTERIALDSSGAQGNGASHYPSISADGRYVAFISSASNLVPGDGNGSWDVFVRDRISNLTERVSVDTTGVEGNGDCFQPDLTADGRFVCFGSVASNLVSGDTNGASDAFLRDRLAGSTEIVSIPAGGGQGDNHSATCSVSTDGRFIAFVSLASNMVPGDTNSTQDIFLRDRLNGTTERVSVATDGAEGNASSAAATISDDGRFVLFGSFASTLVPGDTNLVADIFLRDRRLSTTERVSVSSIGLQVSGGSGPSSLSHDSRYIVFSSAGSTIVAGDTNGFVDVFIRDLSPAGFTSFCDPGTNNIIACPCGNPPSGRGRGCDNSSSTGGASLTATGVAYLSIDSLCLTTSAEKPTATSILLQGSATIPGGSVFGQGVRCAGGTLKRLYVKTAVAGSIVAPDPNSNDPAVSLRSASLGDPIQPGETRTYLVYYRDSTVLGGCPAFSTFNATQTGSVGWWP